MINETEQMGGIKRAAILLMALGEECASAVLRQMGPREVQALGYEMTQLKNINRHQVNKVIAEFSSSIDQHSSLIVGTEDFVRKVLMQALGDDKAANLMDRIIRDNNKNKGLESFKWLDTKSIAEIIRYEHPQIVAIVLAHLEPGQAADVVANFPEHLRADVLLRVANIDSIQPEALQELNRIMENHFTGNANMKMSSIGGVKVAAQILNHIDSALENEILDNIREIEPEIGQSIQDVMFVFDNLNDMVDRDIQTMLREISSDVLILALRGANNNVREKIYKNMSKRAADMLRDDLETKGPVKIKDVEKAQKDILSTIRRLADAGEISLRAKGVDEYI
ncbi:MAG: flagellar motor switch protein FliG [Gammaproteobacteria bacterium SG8_15]|nr:MAG: flagellar motor switch protein FliG [Gammaproteobacteria bacterium SG8_15]